MAVRSTQLGTLDLASGAETNIYTVPAGYRTIVKCVLVRNKAGTAQGLAIRVKSGATTLALYNVWTTASGTTGDSVTWLPWIVLNAGQTISFQPAAAGGSCVASGAELLL